MQPCTHKTRMVGCCLVVAVLAGGSQAGAQLSIVQNGNATQLVGTLVSTSGGATVSNETLTGNASCAGVFSGGLGVDGGADFAIASGIVLSSGLSTTAVPPNVSDNTTGAFNSPGDPDLDLIVAPFNTVTFDACALEFDFQCPVGSQGSDISFRYNFTSEEYNEFTNSIFTNVFGFFLNGSNIALLPDGVTPVQINTVNGGNPFECFNGVDDDGDGPIDGADSDCFAVLDDIVGENNSNSGFFNNNDCSDGDGGVPCPDGIEADGYTDTLVASSAVGAGLNHIKLVIADAGDAVLDSWMFMEGGSFECVVNVKTDLKPQSNPNCVNPRSGGLLSVAIFGSAAFDVTTINTSSLTFGGAAAIRCAFEDAFMEGPTGVFSQDGITDLVCKFKTKQVDLPQPGDDCATVELNGNLLDGTPLRGSDIACVPGDETCNLGNPTRASRREGETGRKGGKRASRIEKLMPN